MFVYATDHADDAVIAIVVLVFVMVVAAVAPVVVMLLLLRVQWCHVPFGLDILLVVAKTKHLWILAYIITKNNLVTCTNATQLHQKQKKPTVAMNRRSSPWQI